VARVAGKSFLACQTTAELAKHGCGFCSSVLRAQPSKAWLSSVSGFKLFKLLKLFKLFSTPK
jgi:hypothetical protein